MGELPLSRHRKAILPRTDLGVHSIIGVNVDLCPWWRPDLRLHQGSRYPVGNVGGTLLLVGLLKLFRDAGQSALLAMRMTVQLRLSSLGLLVLELAHSQICVVSLGVLTQLLDQIRSLHLYLLSGYHSLGVWILDCHEAIWWSPVDRLLLSVLEGAHACYVYVELHAGWNHESLL